MTNGDLVDSYVDLLKSALCASLYEESAWRRVEGPKKQHLNGASMRDMLTAKAKHAVLRFLRARNLLLVRTNEFDPERRQQGIDWPLFGFTMTGRCRLDALQACVQDVIDKRVPGDFIETGVWRGGSAILMRALLKLRGVTDRIPWSPDSFQGMPVPRTTHKKLPWEDQSDREYLTVSLEQVQKHFARFGLLDDQVRFLKGWFHETLPTAPIERLANLRMDGDLYESTRDSLVNLYHKVKPGGYVLVDDYDSWEGCRMAVDEFRTEYDITSEIKRIDSDSVMWKVHSPLGS